MSGSRLDLFGMASQLGIYGHLVECRHADNADWRTCQWCTWALGTPAMESLLDIRHDAHALLASPAHGTVPWVVAAVRLLQLADEVDLNSRIPSVREAADRARRLVTDDLDRLRAFLRSAVAPGGPVEQRCLHSARLLAAAALQQPEHAHLLDRLPAGTRLRVEEVAALVSTNVQVASLLPHIDAHHRQPLPHLRTQPEWAPSSNPATTRARLHDRNVTTPGSLEAMVVDSIIDRVTTTLTEIGESLTQALPPIAFRRSATTRSHSSTTRSMLWRIAHIDWHLTFIDTDHAACWNARIEHGGTVTDAPWQVAVAIQVTQPHGLMSATLQECTAPERLIEQG